MQVAKEREYKIGQFFDLPVALVDKIDKMVFTRRIKRRQLVIEALEEYFEKNNEGMGV